MRFAVAAMRCFLQMSCQALRCMIVMNNVELESYMRSLLWDLELMSANYKTARPVAELMVKISIDKVRRGEYS